jgi:hypothetical protein
LAIASPTSVASVRSFVCRTSGSNSLPFSMPSERSIAIIVRSCGQVLRNQAVGSTWTVSARDLAFHTVTLAHLDPAFAKYAGF